MSEPRDAATVLVLRDGAAGPEVLMGRRHAGHSFMPNSLVFPGGGVDPADHDGAVAAPFPPHVIGFLERQGGSSLAHALGVAMARELEEETGLTLGTPPALDAVDYLCRAVTPVGRPRRFDARFFVVSADRVKGMLAGSGELEALGYLPVRDALASELEFATRGALDQFASWLALSPSQRLARTGTPILLERLWQPE